MSLRIVPAGVEQLPAFFVYLNAHLGENGADGFLFQPLARGSKFPPEREQAFTKALAAPLNQAGWRRLLLAMDGTTIAGHIDLRLRPDAASAHRCLLGMGVRSAYRKAGLGQALIEAAIAWAREHTHLAWIDLEVLSENMPARRLYQRMGFVQTGEIADMFRIEGQQLGYTYMSRAL